MMRTPRLQARTASLVMVFALTLGSALQAQPGGGDGPPPSPVQVAKVVNREVNRKIELVGTAYARRRTTVAAQEAGAIKELPVEDGMTVSKGDPLAILDTEDLEHEIAEAEASLNRIRAQHKLAENRARRSKELFEKGRISEEEYQEDEFGSEASAAQIRQGEVQLERLQDRLARATVRAPFDGVVSRKRTEVGEWVNRGGAVVDLMDLSHVHVELNLPERYVSTLQRDGDVPVHSDALPGITLTGKIVAVVPDADLDAHTVPVKVEVANADAAIPAGMFLRATLTVSDTKMAMLVPKDAVVRNASMAFVYAVVDGAAQMVPVQTGQSYGNDVEVMGQLQPGMVVVTRGNERIRPGQNLRLLNDPDAPIDGSDKE